MGKSVMEEHKSLYHYTTAAGLLGIIQSQQLWATSIAYLNDAEEHTGFFDRRLSYLLEEPIQSAVAEIANTAAGRSRIDARGGVETAVQELMEAMKNTLRSVMLKVNKPYVTAFCSAVPKDAPNDGLLSQWRGYGTDGGYAIVFETNGLHQLLDKESSSFHYQFLVFGDVEYYDQDTSQKALHQETLKREAIVKQAIRNYILTKNLEELDKLSGSITALSCMHKHSGFGEEVEVRIVAIPSNNELLKREQKSGDKKLRKPVEFSMKNGVLVPYIKLFGRKLNGKATNLPISKVIVGPHPDRFKRQKAVELMLEQHEIDAEVTASDIPYLGR